MVLIGIAGKKYSGKDTTADILVKSNFRKISFARNLKEILKVMFGWDDDVLENKKEEICKTWNVKPRKLLQLLGTDFLRYTCAEVIDNSFLINDEKVEFSYHIKKLFLDNKESFENNDDIVISDVRFPDEAKFIKKLNGIIIYINRDTEENDFSNHISENNFDKIKYDYVINNDSTINNLGKRLNIILELINY